MTCVLVLFFCVWFPCFCVVGFGLVVTSTDVNLKCDVAIQLYMCHIVLHCLKISILYSMLSYWFLFFCYAQYTVTLLCYCTIILPPYCYTVLFSTTPICRSVVLVYFLICVLFHYCTFLLQILSHCNHVLLIVIVLVGSYTLCNDTRVQKYGAATKLLCSYTIIQFYCRVPVGFYCTTISCRAAIL